MSTKRKIRRWFKPLTIEEANPPCGCVWMRVEHYWRFSNLDMQQTHAKENASGATVTQPTLTAEQRDDLCKRITDYLMKGGFFNPEAMEHDKVRALLLECRAALLASRVPATEPRETDLERASRWLHHAGTPSCSHAGPTRDCLAKEFAAARAAVPPDGLREALEKLADSWALSLSGSQYNCAKELRDALATPAERPPDCISLVRTILAQHQTAYARFHCEEKRGVIESRNMAIGYAAVELEKALKRAAEPETPVDALRDVEAHLTELSVAWERGILSEHDGLGGTRSNRNADVLRKVRASLPRTPSSHPCPLVGCNRTEKHMHPISGPNQAAPETPVDDVLPEDLIGVGIAMPLREAAIKVNRSIAERRAALRGTPKEGK